MNWYEYINVNAKAEIMRDRERGCLSCLFFFFVEWSDRRVNEWTDNLGYI